MYNKILGIGFPLTLLSLTSCSSLHLRDEVTVYSPSSGLHSSVIQGHARDRDTRVLKEKNKSAIENRLPDTLPASLTGRPNLRTPDNIPFREEWKWNTESNKDKPPQNCLALSGGGIRSASFSIGVLKALEENGSLKKMDVISAVSGGSYAMSWYLVQKRHFPNDVFQTTDSNGEMSDSPSLKYLERNADFVSYWDYFTAGVIGNTAFIPLNFVANGIFGWHANTNLARDMYERRIRKVYHAIPKGGNQLSRSTDALENISVEDLGRSGTRAAHGELEPTPPFFIINATVQIEEDMKYHGAKLSNSIFEFTPLQYGSDAFGRYTYSGGKKSHDAPYDDFVMPQIPLSRAVSISGAALDITKSTAGPAKKMFMSALNQDLGYYLPNPAVNNGYRAEQKFIPFPLYLFHNWERDVLGTHLYLTDGGHSENLGAYSLVRRLCRNITIVDAEHDPFYVFDAYESLKTALKTEMGIDFSVTDIDTTKARNPEERNSKAPHLGTRWKQFAKNPVMDGTICCLPSPYSDNDNDNDKGEISVTYVKLAYDFDVNSCSNTNEKLSKYFCESVTTNRDSSSPFPQQPTTRQSYTADQFLAYRLLGEEVVRSRRK
jgi:hypothetical protein